VRVGGVLYEKTMWEKKGDDTESSSRKKKTVLSLSDRERKRESAPVLDSKKKGKGRRAVEKRSGPRGFLSAPNWKKTIDRTCERGRRKKEKQKVEG